MHRIYFVLFYLLCSGSSYSSDRHIDLELIDVIDSAFVLYQSHDYLDMSNYLEGFDIEQTSNDSLRLDYYYALMMSYGHQRRLEEHLSVIIDGILLSEKIQHRWMLLSFYREMASFHDEVLNDFSSALTYFDEAVMYLDAVDSLSKSGLMMDYALTCVNAEKYEKAEQYYQKAFNYIPASDSMMIYDVMAFYTPYLVEIHEPDSALKYALSTYHKWNEIGFMEGYIESGLDISEAYLQKQDLGSALIYAQEATDAANALGNLYYYEDALDLLADVQEENGLLLESQKTFSELASVTDSIELMLKDNSIDQMRIDFLTSKFKDELDEISEVNLSLASDIKSERNLYRYLLTGLVVFMIFGAIFYYKRNQHVKTLKSDLAETESRYGALKDQYHSKITELEQNKRKLTSHALFLEKKDETLKTLRKMLAEINGEGANVQEKISSATRLAERSIKIDNNWDSFRYFFEQVYPTFNNSIKELYPDLSSNELRVLSYIKMGLTDKESARLLGINTASFQKNKYRLKKKFSLPKEVSIEQYLSNIEVSLANIQ